MLNEIQLPQVLDIGTSKDNDFSHGAAWMRGDVMPTRDAAIPVTDWGLTHSDITYDVVHTWDGRFFG